MTCSTLKALLVCGTAFSVLVVASSAHAQEAVSAAAGQDAAPNANEKPYRSDVDPNDDIIVTATKRPESVRKIAGSVSAVSGKQLDAIGANSFADYLTSTPGVVFNAGVPGLSSVTVRGISTTTQLDLGQGTTGYFINDVPLTDPFSAVAIPDIDTFDVENVTVLRGPQGTLFGSASLGGAINYQAAKPNLAEYEFRVQGTVESVKDGAVGRSGKAMVNIPLLRDTLAVRAVYTNRRDAGYIDNIGTSEKNSNTVLTRGGRVEVTLKPDSRTDINYLFLRQVQSIADNGYEQPALAGPLRKNTAGAEPFNFTTTIHNLRLDRDLGFATLTATATVHRKSQFQSSDVTASFGAVVPGAAPVTDAQVATSKGKTFELRIASKADQAFDYVIGVFHDSTREQFVETVSAPGAAAVIESTYGGLFGAGIGAAGAPGDAFLTAAVPFKGKESALFGEVGYRFSEQLKVSVGGRGFVTKSDNVSTVSGFYELLAAGTLEYKLQGRQKESGFTPKASITWTPSREFMSYALVSKGFRFGGPNINPSTIAAPIPAAFKSDSLINYELGMRSTLLDGRLQLDATLYYIDWSNIQLRALTPTNLAYGTNAGKAESYGLEGTAVWRVANGLVLQNNVTYLNAKLKEAFAPGGFQPNIPKNSTLPGASKWQVSNSVNYTAPIGEILPTFLVTHRYISKAPGNFFGGLDQGGYNLFNGRITGHLKPVDISLFVNNLTNVRGVTSGTNFASFGVPLRRHVVTPRTIGVTLDLKL